MFKYFIQIFLLFFVTYNANSQVVNVDYDSALALKLGGNDNGMKQYVLVLLKPGITSVNKIVRDSLFKGHMNNITRLADEGTLILAGPFEDNDTYSGIFILNSGSIEEGNRIVQTDPAVKARLLEAECYLWYGSAAIRETVNIHNRIRKYKPGK